MIKQIFFLLMNIGLEYYFTRPANESLNHLPTRILVLFILQKETTASVKQAPFKCSEQEC